jgi:hypothetical protein
MWIKRKLLLLLLALGLLVLALGGWLVDALRWPFSAIATSPSSPG